MRWFAAYWITVLICLIGTMLFWLGAQDIGPLDDWITWLMPGGVVTWWTIPLLVSLIYAFARFVLRWVLAYTESVIEAAPRGDGVRGRRRAAIGSAAYTAFGNPTGFWLAPFSAFLSVAAVLAILVRVGMNRLAGLHLRGQELVILLLLTLMTLYGVTVTSAMLRPDRPQSLRHEEDPELDPILLMRE